MNQSDRQRRRLHTSQLPAPSLHPTRITGPLPTITTLNAPSSRYPTRPVQNPLSAIEDELHSESDTQQASAKQESGEGGTTSDFVKKLFRSVFEFEF